MSDNTFSTWSKQFKFKFVAVGLYQPDLSSIQTDPHIYTTPYDSYGFDFGFIRDILLGEGMLPNFTTGNYESVPGAIPQINSYLSNAGTMLEVDFLSSGTTGTYPLLTTSTCYDELVYEYDGFITEEASDYKNPSFAYTYYTLYKDLFNKGEVDTETYGECIEYTVYVTLKLKEEFLSSDKPSFTWKFYNSYEGYAKDKLANPLPETPVNLTTTTTTLVDIFGKPTPPQVPQLRQKSDDGTYTFYTCTSWTQQEDGSFLANYTSSEVEALFTVNDADIFEEAVGYYYGEKAPVSGYFLPVGDNDKESDTQDILIQYPEGNQYSTIVEIPEFTWGQQENQLAYIQKGTFPLFNNKASWEATADTADTISVKVTYNTDTGAVSKIEVAGTETFNSVISEIKRLGFILVGGGGGAGGYAKYDNCSSDGTMTLVCPGGGGGGGEVLCGVLNVEAPEIVRNDKGYFVLGQNLGITSSIQNIHIKSLEFKVTLGKGGEPGTVGSNDNGSVGNSGGSSYISRIITAEYTKNGDTWFTTSLSKENIIEAKGGSGGGRGSGNLSKIEAGIGGYSGRITDKDTFFGVNWCGVCYSIQGNSGASIDIDSTTPENSSSDGVSAFIEKLYFSQAEASNTYSKSLDYKAVAAKVEVKKDRQELQNCIIPGGQSYGLGASENNAGWGGGGAGGITTGTNAKGGRGFLGLYY